MVLHAPMDLRLEDVDEVHTAPGWLKLAVERVGICGTDKALFSGDYGARKLPIILGHEVAGRVVEVGGSVRDRLIGRRVTTEINVNCGNCWFCRSGMREHCLRRDAIGISLDGGMAEYMLTRADLAHPIEDLTPQQGALVEPLAAALKPFKMSPPEKGLSIAILGVGTLGLLSAQVAKLFEPERLIAVYRRENKRVRLAERLGATPLKFKEALELARELRGSGFDLVIEATGNPEGLDQALSLVRARGKIFAKSTHGKRTCFDYTRAVVNEVSVIGSRCGPFKEAIELIREGKVSVDDLVTSVRSLDEGVEAFERSFDPDEVKVQIEVSRNQ